MRRGAGENNLKVGAGMPERVQKTKCRGGVAEKIEGGMPQRVKKTKCGGGGVKHWGEAGVRSHTNI